MLFSRSLSSDDQPRNEPTHLHSPLHSPVNIVFEAPRSSASNTHTSPPLPPYDNTDNGPLHPTSPPRPRVINVIRRPSENSNPRGRVTKIYLPQRAGNSGFLFSSPEPKTQVRICRLSSLSSLLLLSFFSHFRLLLQNHWSNFNQTWNKPSLGEGFEVVQMKGYALFQREIITK